MSPGIHSQAVGDVEDDVAVELHADGSGPEAGRRRQVDGHATDLRQLLSFRLRLSDLADGLEAVENGDPALIDRLMEMCRGITLTGQSWRTR